MAQRLQFEVRPDPGRMRRLKPGFYSASDRELHVHIPELLDALGLLDTLSNRERLTELMVSFTTRELPDLGYEVVP